MGSSVIGPLTTCCGNCDGSTCVSHRQLTVSCSNSVVSGLAGGEFIASQLIGHRALTRESDATGHNCGNLIISNKTLNIIFIPALRSSGIGKFHILRRNGHSLRIDCQGTGNRRDCVICRHILGAMHNFIAFGNRVISFRGIGNIGNTTAGLCNKFVTFKKFSGGNRYCAVRMGLTVVSPCFACCGNRDSNACTGHCQLTVHRGYSVVSCSSSGEVITRHHIGHRTLTRERDASGHNSSNIVVSQKAIDIIFRPTLSCSVIGKLFILCRNSHGLRIDCKGSGCSCDDIV